MFNPERRKPSWYLATCRHHTTIDLGGRVGGIICLPSAVSKSSGVCGRSSIRTRLWCAASPAYASDIVFKSREPGYCPNLKMLIPTTN